MKRTALVTGGNRGIGLAIVQSLAELEFHVLLGSRDIAAGQAAAAPLREKGFDVSPVSLNLLDPASIDAVVSEIRQSGRSVGVLVNNAGLLREKPLLDLTDNEIAESISVHVTGPIRLIRSLVPTMTQCGYGRIVNISSGWGSFAEGLGGPGAYGITKAALNAMTVRLAAELPSTIKINAMCPGWVRTRMGGESASLSPEEAASTAVWLATLPENGPSGGFFRELKRIEW